MIDKESENMKQKDDHIPSDVLEFMCAVPHFKDRGVEHTAPCPCGGTIHAIGSKYNGHLHAWCDKCGARLIE